MLINVSNHPSEKWGKGQRDAAMEYGGIIDIPFPSVDPHANEGEIVRIADALLEEIQKKASHQDVVMVQGEFTLTYEVVKRLKQNGVKVVSACSERVAEEKEDEKGNSVRTSYFEFVQFREYI